MLAVASSYLQAGKNVNGAGIQIINGRNHDDDGARVAAAGLNAFSNIASSAIIASSMKDSNNTRSSRKRKIQEDDEDDQPKKSRLSDNEVELLQVFKRLSAKQQAEVIDFALTVSRK